MAKVPTDEEVERLQAFAEPFCLTIYVPHIDQGGAATGDADRIDLKNMLRQAEQSLLDEKVSARQVRKTLRPARELLRSREFWPLRPQALALFLHTNLFQYYHLPDGDVPHLLTIERGFNLEPLLALVEDNRQYLVLALGHKDVRLYQGDHFSLRRLRLKNFPSDLKQALNIDEFPKVAEAHSIAIGSERGSKAFHGQYNRKQTDKEMLLMFFQMIDRSLKKFLQRKNLPMILAGVEYLIPIYRQANTSPYLMEGHIEGNVSHEDPEQLREAAWAILEQQEAA